jgi:hypothetical protein
MGRAAGIPRIVLAQVAGHGISPRLAESFLASCGLSERGTAELPVFHRRGDRSAHLSPCGLLWLGSIIANGCPRGARHSVL